MVSGGQRWQQQSAPANACWPCDPRTQYELFAANERTDPFMHVVVYIICIVVVDVSHWDGERANERALDHRADRVVA